jgi:hypothetical protein
MNDWPWIALLTAGCALVVGIIVAASIGWLL